MNQYYKEPTDILKYLDLPKNNYNSPYTFLGDSIPRVTTILSSMLHDEYLLNWANSLGWKHKNHKTEVEASALIGTHTHAAIERFLKTNKTDYFETIDQSLVSEKSVNAFKAFLTYWAMLIENNDVDILGSEIELTCPYFGGTCDALLRINGDVYAFDFKTSNSIGYKYILQLSAYKYILENYCYIPVDGICILQLSKDCPTWYWEYLLNQKFLMDRDLINKAFEFFVTLVQGYMYRVYYEDVYKSLTYEEQWGGRR